MSVLLEVEGLEFSYGSVQVLFGIDLHVQEGEILALLGTNGAGKSTVLRAVAGLARPGGGTVRFRGQDMKGLDVVDHVKAGIVLLSGGKAAFPDLTVRENLEVGGWLLRGRPSDMAARIDRSLSLFPALRARLSAAAGVLSGGEQQQLAIAKALLLEPSLLCIDELSLGLAPVVVEQLLEVVGDVAASGTTMVLVEQSLNVAATLCSRAYFLEKGEVRFEGAPRDLLERDDIARAVFLGGDKAGARA